MRPWWRTIRVQREAWIRFFIAIGGLTLAFLAALFSSVTRQSGNIVATAILASLALLLAGIVGLTTVPYLARRVVLARMPGAIDYDLTREGLIYLGLGLTIGITALTSGNNLLFIVVAAMLAAIVVSGMASLAVLRGLELDVVLPRHVFARTPVLAEVALRNRRRWLPSFSVGLAAPRQKRLRRRLRLRRTIFAFPWWWPPEKQWLRLRDFRLRMESEPAPTDAIFTDTVYFPHLPPRSTMSANVQLNFARRGSYRQDTFGLTTRFPFSFLKKTRRIQLPCELIAYPPVEPADSSLEILPMITGEFEAFMRGRGYDLYRIRDYQPEDPRNHVDWKATAKTGELKVREFTREDERKLRIVFDNPPPALLDETQYENAIAMAASLAWHFAGENTELAFAAPAHPGSNDVYEFLKYLALAQPASSPSFLDQLEVTDDYNLILTARQRGSIPTVLWTRSYIVFLNGQPAAARRNVPAKPK